MYRPKRDQLDHIRTTYAPKTIGCVRPSASAGLPKPTIDPRPFLRDLEVLESHLRGMLRSENEELVTAAYGILTELASISLPPTVPQLDRLLQCVYGAIAAHPRVGATWEEVRVLTRRLHRTARTTRYRTQA